VESCNYRTFLRILNTRSQNLYGRKRDEFSGTFNTANLDVRRAVGGQVDVEAVVVVVVAAVVAAQLPVEQHQAVVLDGLARLNDGTHGGKGRQVPLHVAFRVVHRRLDERTVIFYVQDTEPHLIFGICVTIKKKENRRFDVSPRAALNHR